MRQAASMLNQTISNHVSIYSPVDAKPTLVSSSLTYEEIAAISCYSSIPLDLDEEITISTALKHNALNFTLTLGNLAR